MSAWAPPRPTRTASLADITANIVRMAGTPEGGPVRDAMAEKGRRLARGAALFIHVISPEAVILAGHFTSLAELLLPTFIAELAMLVSPDVVEQTSIVISRLGADAPLHGAAARISDAVLANPAALLMAEHGCGLFHQFFLGKGPIEILDVV